MIDQVKYMVDDDDEEIKFIFNKLHLKVFHGDGDIANLDLPQIKRNQYNKRNKPMKTEKS